MADGTRMRQRRATKSQWDTSNYVLADGEIGYEVDTGVIKIGNGTTPWTSLSAAFGSTYLPLLGKAADSDRLDGIDSSGFVQIGDTSALAAPSKVALRNSAGRLKAATGTESDDLTTLAQQTASIKDAKRLLNQTYLTQAGSVTAADIFNIITVGNPTRAQILNLTIPLDTVLTGVQAGSWFEVAATATGPVRVVAAAGVTLSGDGRVYGVGGVIRVTKMANNSWMVTARNDPADAYAKLFAFADTNVTGWAIYWQNIPLNAESIDSHNGHPTGVITGSDTDATSRQNRYTCQPGQAGTYRVSGQVNITIGTASVVHCRILKNGNWFKGGSGIIGNTSIAGLVQTGEKLVTLAEGDWVSMQGYCSNSNWNTDAGESAGGSSTSWLNVQRID